jgi:hypothetical protein
MFDHAARETLPEKSSFTGHHGHFTGTVKKRKHNKLTFTVDVTDNGPGNTDTFLIELSTGYSASGNLTSGDITGH